MAKVDRYERPHVRLDRRRLAYGGYFLQYRFLLGTEGRGERAIPVLGPDGASTPVRVG